MGLFHHPHLTRGIVKTAVGAFAISRGIVEMPDAVGESLGWRPADTETDTPSSSLRPRDTRPAGAPSRGERG
jgi:hypothetical protein